MPLDATMQEKVNEFMATSFGGSTEEIGEIRDVGTCGRRPSLTLADVSNVAQWSFNITKFEPAIPCCMNGGRVLKCNFDTGNCCQRPQVEFNGRYYDTAIAAMDLGANKSEAFAPLVHARALAYTLEACDPDVINKGNLRQTQFRFKADAAIMARTQRGTDGA